MRAVVRLPVHGSAPAPADADFIPCGISTAETELVLIPRRLRTDLITRLGALGIHFSEHRRGSIIRLIDLDMAQIPTLPSLEIVIRTAGDVPQVVQIGMLEPNDYLYHSHDSYEIHFYRTNTPDSFVIPPSVVRNMLIHFDYDNNRIGFGDPLVEIV